MFRPEEIRHRPTLFIPIHRLRDPMPTGMKSTTRQRLQCVPNIYNRVSRLRLHPCPLLIPWKLNLRRPFHVVAVKGCEDAVICVSSIADIRHFFECWRAVYFKSAVAGGGAAMCILKAGAGIGPEGLGQGGGQCVDNMVAVCNEALECNGVGLEGCW